ncbi:MAG: hypothetical protein ACR2QT_10985 [Woeseiaceae bacterium]
MRATNVFSTTLFLSMLSILAACSGSPTAQTSTSSNNSAYQDILVLAIADNYDGRAQYERAVASGLRKEGIVATPYHEAVGGSGDISREKARELIDKHGFDGVLVTQVRSSESVVEVGQDSAGKKVSRRNDRPVDFFRYSYEELDEPGAISVLAEATLDTDLHTATDSSIVWSFSWASKRPENVGILIDESSEAVVRRLKRDKLLGK